MAAARMTTSSPSCRNLRWVPSGNATGCCPRQVRSSRQPRESSADPEIVPTLERIGGSSLVQSGTIVAVGHSPRVILPDEANRLARLRLRCHGDSCFSIYEADGDEVGHGEG